MGRGGGDQLSQHKLGRETCGVLKGQPQNSATHASASFSLVFNRNQVNRGEMKLPKKITNFGCRGDLLKLAVTQPHT